jgi:hypothetical protein
MSAGGMVLIALLTLCIQAIKAALANLLRSLRPGSHYLAAFSSTTKVSESELIQYLNPLGAGPSGNTWPKCESQTLHSTSIRVIP